MTANTVLALSSGAFIGVWARWGLLQWLPASGGLPWAILLANLSGSLLAGMAFGWAQSNQWLGSNAYLFFSVGLLGAFTTFSAFSVDCARFWQAGQWGLLAIYLALSVIGGVALALLGWHSTR